MRLHPILLSLKDPMRTAARPQGSRRRYGYFEGDLFAGEIGAVDGAACHGAAGGAQKCADRL
jgi:hypothetical protein